MADLYIYFYIIFQILFDKNINKISKLIKGNKKTDIFLDLLSWNSCFKLNIFEFLYNNLIYKKKIFYYNSRAVVSWPISKENSLIE